MCEQQKISPIQAEPEKTFWHL